MDAEWTPKSPNQGFWTPRGLLDISSHNIPAAGVNHGFLLSGGHFSTIDYHDADSTFANAISASGDIVGSHVVAGVTHGFLLLGDTYNTVELSPYVPGARAVKSSAPATTVISSATTD